jgi:hypothetical protein
MRRDRPGRLDSHELEGGNEMLWTSRIALALGVILWVVPTFAVYESFNLAPGFTPDPASGSGQSGGPVDATKYGSTAHGPCTGKIDDSPDHTMVLTAPFSYLRVHAISSQDVSLVIRNPDGSFRCNDDADGLNPVIEGSWPAGTYQIYIGSVTAGTHPYTLAVSELRQGSSSGTGSAGATGDFQNVTLGPGFVPDPRNATGSSGGPTNASSMGSTADGPCTGMIDSTPDHVLTLTHAFTFLKLHARSDRDISLVVRGPGGLRCNDDHDGLNPVIQGSWPAGRYEVFIGSVDSGNHRYTLSITEHR